MLFRSAILSYTNETSGVGVIAHGLFKWLPGDSYLSVPGRKGQGHWTDRQLNSRRPNPWVLRHFLRRYQPDTLLSVETMFDCGHLVYDVCAERHISTATVIMHESYNPGRTCLGLYLCPTQVCYARVEEPNKAYFELPIELEHFPPTIRTQALRFLHIMGYGAAYNRRQTREVVAGFLEANLPGATLTVHCLQDWRKEYGDRQDPRVTYRRQLMPLRRTVYRTFDALIQPESYAGFGLPLLEAQACGMPVITTNAPPMNEQAHDPDALVPVDQVARLQTRSDSPTAVNTNQYLVTPEGVSGTIRRLAAGDIRAKSIRARRYAETRAWTEDRAEELRALLRNIPAGNPH